MDIHFTGHGIDVSPDLKHFTEGKLNLLSQHFPHILSIHITFSTEKLQQIVEGTVHVTKDTIHAHASAPHTNTAVEELVHKLDRQLIKHKEKTHQNRGSIRDEP